MKDMDKNNMDLEDIDEADMSYEDDAVEDQWYKYLITLHVNNYILGDIMNIDNR